MTYQLYGVGQLNNIDGVAVLGTPLDRYSELGYTLKVVNGPRPPFVAGNWKRNRSQYPSTTQGCFQVTTPCGNALLRPWIVPSYNGPLSYDRCRVPRPFGPPYGSALGCGCQGGCGPIPPPPPPAVVDDVVIKKEKECKCECENEVNINTTKGWNCVGACPCASKSPEAWSLRPRPYRDGLFGYLGESDAPIGPDYKANHRVFQSGYYHPEVVDGPPVPLQVELKKKR